LAADLPYDDPVFRLCSARLVTHYWRHATWLEDGGLLRDVDKVTGIPGALIHGRLDLGAPLDMPWMLAASWGGSQLVVIDDTGHTRDHDRGTHRRDRRLRPPTPMSHGLRLSTPRSAALGHGIAAGRWVVSWSLARMLGPDHAGAT
jgi:hypothetical protein